MFFFLSFSPCRAGRRRASEKYELVTVFFPALISSCVYAAPDNFTSQDGDGPAEEMAEAFGKKAAVCARNSFILISFILDLQSASPPLAESTRLSRRKTSGSSVTKLTGCTTFSAFSSAATVGEKEAVATEPRNSECLSQ